MDYPALQARAVIEFGLSPNDFKYLTIREFNALAELHLQNLKTNAELERNVYLNAIYNSKRKKGQKFIELFKEKQVAKKRELSKEEIKRQRAIIFGE